MHHDTDDHSIHSRMLQLTEELSAGCDSDFDVAYDDLDREFQELRCLNSTSEAR